MKAAKPLVAKRIRLHSDVAMWLSDSRRTESCNFAGRIYECIHKWKIESSIDAERAWARLVYATHTAPFGHSVDYSIKIPKDKEKICSDAARSVSGVGWQGVLNGIVRLHGVWPSRPKREPFEFQSDGLERIRCVAGHREFLLSANAEGEFGSKNTWLKEGGETDSKGRFVIRQVEFESDGMWLISGASRNFRSPRWWNEMSSTLAGLITREMSESDAVGFWWNLFCIPWWTNFEIEACDIWARREILKGHLRMLDVPPVLDELRAHQIWRARILDYGHDVRSGRTPRPLHPRVRTILQLTQNLSSSDPGATARDDVRRAMTIYDHRAPTDGEIDNFLKRLYERGYARTAPKSG